MACSLMGIMMKCNINANLVRTTEQLYDMSTIAVQMNNSTGERVTTTVGVRQGCFLSPILFNIFVEQGMTDALEENDKRVINKNLS